MANIVSTGSTPQLFQDLWDVVIDGFKLEKKDFENYVKPIEHDRIDWKVYELSTIGLPQQVEEGENAPVTFYNSYATKTIRPVKYMLSLQITQEAIRFNLYESDAPHLAKQFTDVFRIRENIQAAEIINQGWNPAVPMLDGQALFDTNHLVQNGSFSNTFGTMVPLIESTLEALSVMGDRFLNLAGLPMASPDLKCLVAGPELKFQINRLLKSMLRSGTGNNDTNALKDLDIIKNVHISKFINPVYFAIRTDIPGSVQIINMPLTMQGEPSIQNQVFVQVVSMMYFFACYEPRAFLGGRQPLNQRAAA